MPLRDHFHATAAAMLEWESLHATWAVEIMRHLNRNVLPRNCVARAQVTVGGRIEVDVGTFEPANSPSQPVSANGATAVAVEPWAPPALTDECPATFHDEYEVQLFQTSGGAVLVGAIELVSPRNKDRPESRRTFAIKCASYLNNGIGLIVVDIVTDRLANMHDELMRVLGQPARFDYPHPGSLYATAYRPRRAADGDRIGYWTFPLAVGQSLPTVPLAMRELPTIPVDLETTYTAACQDNRLA